MKRWVPFWAFLVDQIIDVIQHQFLWVRSVRTPCWWNHGFWSQAWSLCTIVRAPINKLLTSDLRAASTWRLCSTTSNKRPIENFLRVCKLHRVSCETMGCPKCTTRFWRAASRSLMTSCCVAGSFLHLSLSSESTRDSTVASSRESKSCRCVLKSFTLALVCPKWQNSQRTPLVHLE